MNNFRICYSCKQEKPLEFYKSKSVHRLNRKCDNCIKKSYKRFSSYDFKIPIVNSFTFLLRNKKLDKKNLNVSKIIFKDKKIYIFRSVKTGSLIISKVFTFEKNVKKYQNILTEILKKRNINQIDNKFILINYQFVL